MEDLNWPLYLALALVITVTITALVIGESQDNEDASPKT